MANKKSTLREYGSHSPDFTKVKKTNDNFRSNFWHAFTYAHYEFTNAILKKETLKFLKSVKSSNIEKAKELHENKFTSIGKFCYILNHGGDVIDDAELKIESKIKTMIDECKPQVIAEEEVKSETTIISIQDRIRAKAGEVISEIDGWIDEFIIDKKTTIKESLDFSKLFSHYDLKSPHIRFIQSYFEKDKTNSESLINTEDTYIKESYSQYTKPEIKRLNQFYKNLFVAIDTIQTTAKVTRAPKKKKPLDLSKLVSKLKYKKEDIPQGLVSVNPVNIPGSSEVWIYNIKTRKLGCYKALDVSGLSVKGTKIVNFSTNSVQKTLRKPVEQLAEFKKTSKVKLRTFIKDAQGVETELTGSINEYCIILRIDK